jgi:two-component system nitrate/nitrite response regulator NarL
MSKKRILLVDDNAMVRREIRSLFASHPYFEVCGEAQHGRDAIEQAPTLLPDLIILDLSMPVMNGLEAAPLLLKILPAVWLILLTLYEQPEVHKKAKMAGIHAVVSKAKASTHLIRQAEVMVGYAA